MLVPPPTTIALYAHGFRSVLDQESTRPEAGWGPVWRVRQFGSKQPWQEQILAGTMFEFETIGFLVLAATLAGAVA